MVIAAVSLAADEGMESDDGGGIEAEKITEKKLSEIERKS